MTKIAFSFLIFAILARASLSYAEYGIQAKTSQCSANQVLQDPACTPGAILTVDTNTICAHGYTKTVRHVTTDEREQVFAEYGIDYSLHAGYEVDHLISLELGGSNEIANLWPESYSIPDGARIKDKLENYLHRQVCHGKMTLQEAQREISGDWFQYYSTMPKPMKVKGSKVRKRSHH